MSAKTANSKQQTANRKWRIKRGKRKQENNGTKNFNLRNTHIACI